MAERKGEDIVYSQDDGGWYASLFKWDSKDDMPRSRSFGQPSPTYGTKMEAVAWARKRGASVFLYP